MKLNNFLFTYQFSNPEITAAKQLGIWMDHHRAHATVISKESVLSSVIESTFTHQMKEETLNKSENVMHNKEQHLQKEFYKKLGEIIKDYDEVLLFGPTDAKVELFNMLKEDHRFAKIKIEIKQADKMSENQQNTFIKSHFSGNQNHVSK